MTERENLPTIIAAQAVAVLSEQRGSLVWRGLLALQESKKRELSRQSQDERYRQARAVYDRRHNAINRWNEKDNPDIFSAFKIFQQLSDENYGKAYYPRYLLYQPRSVIEEGRKHAVHFKRLAFDWCFANQANQDVELWCDLGCLYYSSTLHVEKNDELSVHWLRKAAEQNNAEAQWNLACKYERGRGVKQNNEQAVYWWTKAAEQGNPIAQGALGQRYEQGRVVKQNNGQAMYWYRKAADQGNAIAQWNLACKYEDGIGVPQNYEEAMRWYRLAADQGYAVAQYRLGVMYDEGFCVGQNDEEAVKWYRLAAEQGVAEAQFNIGLLYEIGQGVPQDDEEAVKWYRLAAEQDNPDAKEALNKLGVDWKK